MPSVGFEGALGQQAMAEQIRQRLMDELNKTKTLHGMGVEDQRLALEKQRFEQEAADRALLRSQQGTAFNETLAEKTAANLTPQSIISPELATRFKNTSLAPLISADQTLPSTSMAAAAPMVGAETPNVSPTVTQNAPTLTGQLRYAGTPKQIETGREQAAQKQILGSPLLSPTQRLAFQAENSGLKVPPNVFEQKDTSALDAARIQALMSNAQHAEQMARIAGDNAAARGEAERAKLALEQAKLEWAKQLAGDKSGQWMPTGDTALDPNGQPSFVFRNPRGEVKYVPAPAGTKIERPGQGGGFADWWRGIWGGSSSAAPRQVRYDTSGKPITP